VYIAQSHALTKHLLKNTTLYAINAGSKRLKMTSTLTGVRHEVMSLGVSNATQKHQKTLPIKSHIEEKPHSKLGH
jgi:hypothetical protein